MFCFTRANMSRLLPSARRRRGRFSSVLMPTPPWGIAGRREQSGVGKGIDTRNKLECSVLHFVSLHPAQLLVDIKAMPSRGKKENDCGTRQLFSPSLFRDLYAFRSVALLGINLAQFRISDETKRSMISIGHNGIVTSGLDWSVLCGQEAVSTSSTSNAKPFFAKTGVSFRRMVLTKAEAYRDISYSYHVLQPLIQSWNIHMNLQSHGLTLIFCTFLLQHMMPFLVCKKTGCGHNLISCRSTMSFGYPGVFECHPSHSSKQWPGRTHHLRQGTRFIRCFTRLWKTFHHIFTYQESKRAYVFVGVSHHHMVVGHTHEKTSLAQ